MLRPIYNGNVATKSMNSLATMFMRCMSVQQSSQTMEQRKHFNERLQVSLCGQISGSPIDFNNGTTVILFHTKNDNDERYAKHRAMIQTTRLQNLLADRLVEGQRVYVSGGIGYAEFQNAEGQRRQYGFIHTNELYRCKEVEGDLNVLNLFGRVELQPQNTDNTTFLNVSTWFFDRNTQSTQKKFHSIMVQDDDNMRQRASCANIGDNVFIYGSLRTQDVRTQDGKWRQTYSIRANNLIFIQPKERSQQHS